MRRRIPEKLDWSALRKAVATADSFASLRGHEGAAARFYFQHWPALIAPFTWEGRHPRPAPDPVNLMLSFGYSLLRSHLAASLTSAGLNPRVGFFHETRGSHTALASDLMEPLRALVDTTVLTLIRKKEVSPGDFRMRGETCACANNAVFTKLLLAWEEMFAARHLFKIETKTGKEETRRSVNDIMDDMAIAFARHVCGEGAMLAPVLYR